MKGLRTENISTYARRLPLFSLCLSASLLLLSSCDQIPGTGESEPELTTTAGKVKSIGQEVDLSCGETAFRLLRVSLEDGREAVTLFKGESEVRTERLPSGSEVADFKLDPLRKTGSGFEMSVEYGGRFYHSKRFEFECRDGSFELVRMNSERFDTNNPSKVSRQDSAVKPAVPFERFGLRLYLID